MVAIIKENIQLKNSYATSWKGYMHWIVTRVVEVPGGLHEVESGHKRFSLNGKGGYHLVPIVLLIAHAWSLSKDLDNEGV